MPEWVLVLVGWVMCSVCVSLAVGRWLRRLGS